MYSHFSNLRLGNSHLSHLLNMDVHGIRYNDWKFLWSKRLIRHTSCVNALALSQNGRWLASGGDDLVVQLWDFYQEDISQCPLVSFTGPMMNILTLAFSNSNKYLLSGGSDARIQLYDVSRLGESNGQSMKGSDQHYKEEDSVRSVSCHPFRDEIFMSGSESGNITQRDVRMHKTSKTNSSTIYLSGEVTSLQYHPLIENFFVTSDSAEGVRLWDTRMAWAGGSEKGVVQNYNTRICRKNATHLADPEASSVVFDRDGSKLAVTLLHYLPTIYTLSDPNPLAICSAKDSSNEESSLARELEDEHFESTEERTYYNSCTMKHGSFGGLGRATDDFYCAGSDDFRAYLWRVPKLEELKEARLEVDASRWFASSQWKEDHVAFGEDLASKRYIPCELSVPIYRLTGHQSIVNTALIHPQLPHIITAGIERYILLHSPTPSASCAADLEPTVQDTRRLNHFEHAEFDVDVERSERETIMFFDGLLTTEGKADPFEIRQWRPGYSDSSSDSDEDDTDDDYYQIV